MLKGRRTRVAGNNAAALAEVVEGLEPIVGEEVDFKVQQYLG